MSGDFDWLPALGSFLGKVATGEAETGLVELVNKGPVEPRDVEVIEVREVKDERPDVIDVPAELAPGEGCGRTFNKGALVCVEHDEHGDCVLRRLAK